MERKKAEQILNNCRGSQIAVIGDMMMDHYYWGSVGRISPEAPVPVIDIENESYHFGGAANVVLNLFSLGVNPLMCGVIGVDEFGIKFKELSEKLGLSVDGLFADSSRPTTVKTRVIGNNQQIARIDREIRDEINPEIEEFFIEIIESLPNLDGIIFADYNKGVITHRLIDDIISLAKKNDIPVFVDPKFINFFAYKDVTLFKPNKKEASAALNLEMKIDSDVDRAGKMLLEKLNCENVLLTLGSRGMKLFKKDGTSSHIETIARHVADVSGAGDTAISTLAAAMAGGADVLEAAFLANQASGIVCEKPGIVSITIEELLKSLQH